jgi:hypothetical protein
MYGEGETDNVFSVLRPVLYLKNLENLEIGPCVVCAMVYESLATGRLRRFSKFQNPRISNIEIFKFF